MVSVLQKVLGDPNEKALKKLAPFVKNINELERRFQNMTDDELRSMTAKFRSRLAKGDKLDDIVPEAFATVREAARRTLKQRHYDVQLVGGLVLHMGQIAEMKTGEGKTLVATLAAYINALDGKGVHVVTVNDYLARRDPVWMGQIYHALGLTVGCLQHDVSFRYDPEVTKSPTGMENLRPVTRAEAYQADITYGTNNEFGFDYLRDNMALDKANRVQRKLNYAIVDEVDNILIDEARTPLIISGPAEEPVQLYQSFAKLVTRLNDETDFTIDERTQAISLTVDGISKMENWTNPTNLYDPEKSHQVHYMENALPAENSKIRPHTHGAKDGDGLTVGIIPQDDSTMANEFCDIVIPSGMGLSRDFLNALSADGVIVIGGGSGTLSEICAAYMYKKPIATLKNSGGMATKYSDQYLDHRENVKIVGFDSPENAVDYILEQIKS